ncbi:MAG: hypothetical protein A3K10_05755 [Bacteroidetes bacterium RIFCSPLOWO2_12_FULL_31_6]|nr:MAG: hypothetical protein A3K10_05755 [Bacteroidetes bacterium RIFCSPLOWO2_12_FULL_31_6]
MQNLLLGIILSFALLFNATPINDELVAAFKNGDSTTIANYFDASVDLSIPENEGVFSNIQAKLVLKTFFIKNKPTDFTVVHNGDSKNNSHYSIGNLKTLKGTFRTYVLYKEVDKKVTILELKIESDD